MFAQPGFNRIYDQSIIGNKQFCKIFTDQNFILAIGSGYESGSPQGILLARLDTFGNLVKQRFIVDSLNDFLANDFLWGDVYKTTKGYYAFPAVALNRGGYLLFQIDSALDIKSIFEFQSPDNYSAFDESISELQDGGFLIAGFISRPNLKQDGFIRRVGKDGNLAWIKYYGDNAKDESFRDMVKISDDRYILCGSKGPDFNNSETARAGLWEVDSNGNVLRTWTGPENPDLIVIVGLLPASDGGFIAHGRIYLGQGPWGSKVQVCLMKFDADLQMEWLRPVGPTTSNYNGFLDMTRTPDGHYLAVGERTAYGNPTQPGGDWGGWMFKFSEQGDSIWARADNAPATFAPSGEFVYGGVGLLSSGSIVAGGEGDVNDNFVGWVVKVSADGCLDSVLCAPSAAHALPSAVDAGMNVYPNPACGDLFVEFPGLSGDGDVSLYLYDLQGRLMLENLRHVTDTDSATVLSCASLPAGMYLLEYRAKNGRRGRKLVVVVH